MQTVLAQLLPDAPEVLVRLRVEYRNASLALFHLVPEYRRDVRLLGEDLPHVGKAHRLKGVLAEYALRYRNALNVMNAPPGDSPGFGKRGNEGEPVRTGGCHGR